MDPDLQICPWAGGDPLYQLYHDQEWGIPQTDDRRLFELLVLEGMQAGLSWLTVLRKREHFRIAFDQFDPACVAGYDEQKIGALLQNPLIIRNQLKIRASVKNARAFLLLQQEHGSFADWLWARVDYKPVINAWENLAQIPARTPLSDQLSLDLRRRGFSFVGSTICYAFMQSAGLVWDHLTTCPCRPSYSALVGFFQAQEQGVNINSAHIL